MNMNRRFLSKQQRPIGACVNMPISSSKFCSPKLPSTLTSLLAEANCPSRLGVLALGDVGGDRAEAGNLAAGVPDRELYHGQGVDVALLKDDLLTIHGAVAYRHHTVRLIFKKRRCVE